MFGNVRGSGVEPDLLTRKIAIKNNDEQKITLTQPTSTSPVFVAELKDVEPGKKFELVVTAKQPLPMGNTSGTIQMNTGLKEMPVLNIPVSIYVTADVEATPQQLVLPLSIPKPLQRLVYVRNYLDKQPMKITDVSVTNPEIKTQLTEPTPGTNWRITVDVPKDFRLAPGGEKLTIKTDNTSLPALIVPIMQAGSMSPMPAAHASPTQAPSPSAVPVQAAPVQTRVHAVGKGPGNPAAAQKLPTKSTPKP